MFFISTEPNLREVSSWQGRLHDFTNFFSWSVLFITFDSQTIWPSLFGWFSCIAVKNNRIELNLETENKGFLLFLFSINTIKFESGNIPVKIESYEVKAAHVINITLNERRTPALQLGYFFGENFELASCLTVQYLRTKHNSNGKTPVIYTLKIKV